MFALLAPSLYWLGTGIRGAALAATTTTALSAGPGVKALVQASTAPPPPSGLAFSLKAFTRAASHPGPRSSMRRRSCTLQTRHG